MATQAPATLPLVGNPSHGGHVSSSNSSRGARRGGRQSARGGLPSQGGGQPAQRGGRPPRGPPRRLPSSDPGEARPSEAANTLPAAPTTQTVHGSAPSDVDAPKEAEICFICASTVIHQALTPCNHRTCHICALRLRALYKTRACAHCRNETRSIIFTDNQTKRYEDFIDDDFEKIDDILGIRYAKMEIFDDTVLLLRYNCPEEDCEVACFGWPDLHRHVRNIHHKMMCDLCTRNKKVFTHEHELFANQELRKHERFGDDNPGAIDQSGFKGHPECGFCRKRFYGDDELFSHCREKHERCHICDRRSEGRQPQYYVNYEALEEHFRKAHFLCLDSKCQEAKFVVFETEMDLKAHQLSEHSNDVSRDVRRDVRTVNISSFDYRAPYQPTSRPPRRGGRGRDPNSEPLPPSSAQPLRRDELAFQRQVEIQSAQSTRMRTFGGQLSSTSTPAGRSQNQGPARGNNSGLPNVDSLTINEASEAPAGTERAITLQEQSRQIQHDAVISRASSMLNHDQTKIEDFRARVSAYKSSTITATQFIDTLLTLFDSSPSALGTLVKELADLYEDEANRQGLLKAWNDWRAVNEDYPTLPGPSGGTAPATPIGGRRILKLKSSTAQSSRSATNRQNSWGHAAPPPTSTTGPAPRVGAPASWIAPPAPRNTTSQPSRPAVIRPNNEAFPALPAATKPNTNIWGLHHGSVKWDDRRSAPSNAWEGANNGSATATGTDAEGHKVDSAAGGGKKKGKKKQTLYKFG